MGEWMAGQSHSSAILCSILVSKFGVLPVKWSTNTKRMKIRNYGKYYGNQARMLGARELPLSRRMDQHQANVRNTEEYSIASTLLSLWIATAAAAYRPPHLRQTTRQVPKLHDEGKISVDGLWPLLKPIHSSPGEIRCSSSSTSAETRWRRGNVHGWFRKRQEDQANT